MSYSFSTKGREATNAGGKMKPGERENVIFVSVEVDDKGDMYFNFKNDSGVMRHKEFAIDPTHEAFKPENADRTMNRIYHIACGLAPQKSVDAINGDGVPFATWAGQLAALLNQKAGLEGQAKIVVHKNFPTFPLFPNFFSSELNKCDWTSNPAYDKYEYEAVKPDAEGDARDGMEDEVDEDESF